MCRCNRTRLRMFLAKHAIGECRLLRLLCAGVVTPVSRPLKGVYTYEYLIIYRRDDAGVVRIKRFQTIVFEIRATSRIRPRHNWIQGFDKTLDSRWRRHFRRPSFCTYLRMMVDEWICPSWSCVYLHMMGDQWSCCTRDFSEGKYWNIHHVMIVDALAELTPLGSQNDELLLPSQPPAQSVHHPSCQLRWQVEDEQGLLSSCRCRHPRGTQIRGHES